MDTKEKLAELKELIQKANYIVFFGGIYGKRSSGLSFCGWALSSKICLSAGGNFVS